MNVTSRQCQGYECAKGEGLPIHGHAPGVTHLCVVAAGRVEIVVGNKQFENGVGVYSLPADVEHGVVALDDDTIFYNVF
jgi:quercetin dioxygenase-like cupin family protein